MKIKLFFLSAAITCVLPVYSAEETKTSTKTVVANTIVVNKLERFGLGKQVPSMNGYDIRARRFIVPAGVSIEEHAHKTNPGIVYVESGSITEIRGKTSRLLKPGDTLIEDVKTVHAYKNTSTKDCVLIAFDLPKSLSNSQ